MKPKRTKNAMEITICCKAVTYGSVLCNVQCEGRRDGQKVVGVKDYNIWARK